MKRKVTRPKFVFSVKPAYGNYFYYPENEDAHNLLRDFGGRKSRKCFAYKHVLWFKRCGAEIEVIKNENLENLEVIAYGTVDNEITE